MSDESRSAVTGTPEPKCRRTAGGNYCWEHGSVWMAGHDVCVAVFHADEGGSR